jgi:hypothetical protein
MNIKELAKKLYAMANDQSGNENDAREKLEQLMQSECISEAELDLNIVKEYHFKWNSERQRRLLMQCLVKVVDRAWDDISLYRCGKRQDYIFELTAQEYIEIKFLFAFHCNLYEKEEQDLYLAYLSKHNLYPCRPQDHTGNDKDEDPEHDAKLAAMKRGLSDIKANKVLMDMRKL